MRQYKDCHFGRLLLLSTWWECREKMKLCCERFHWGFRGGQDAHLVKLVENLQLEEIEEGDQDEAKKDFQSKVWKLHSFQLIWKRIYKKCSVLTLLDLKVGIDLQSNVDTTYKWRAHQKRAKTSDFYSSTKCMSSQVFEHFPLSKFLNWQNLFKTRFSFWKF